MGVGRFRGSTASQEGDPDDLDEGEQRQAGGESHNGDGDGQGDGDDPVGIRAPGVAVDQRLQ